MEQVPCLGALRTFNQCFGPVVGTAIGFYLDWCMPRTTCSQTFAVVCIYSNVPNLRNWHCGETLVRNSPDFDFSLRPAIEAGVIQDHSIIVPLISEGDPRPSLVEIIKDLPLLRQRCTRLFAPLVKPIQNLPAHTPNRHRF